MEAVFKTFTDDSGLFHGSRPIQAEETNQPLAPRMAAPNSAAHPGQSLQVRLDFTQGLTCHRNPGFLYLFTSLSGPTSAQAVVMASAPPRYLTRISESGRTRYGTSMPARLAAATR